MKIEIRKRTDYTGTVYFIYADEKCLSCKFSLKDAEIEYEKVKSSNTVKEVWETIRQDEFKPVNN